MVRAVSGRFPDFLGIGAQKCGTTWLHRNLSAQPAIWMPRWKEVHYFNRIHRDVPGWVDVLRPVAGAKMRAAMRSAVSEGLGNELRGELRFWLARRDIDWYRSLFPESFDGLVGEITPAYSTLEDEQVAEVEALKPDLKIFFLMRNPVERAWSAAVMGMQQEWSSPTGLDIDDLRAVTGKRAMRLRGDYIRTLDIWSSHFPSDQIFVGFLEDVSFRPSEFLAATCEFLGVEAVDVPPTGKEHARSGSNMPLEIARFLAEDNHELLERLSSTFGWPASEWLSIAEWLMEEASGQEVRYPLWNTPIGLASDRPGLVSGTLDSLV